MHVLREINARVAAVTLDLRLTYGELIANRYICECVKTSPVSTPASL